MYRTARSTRFVSLSAAALIAACGGEQVKVVTPDSLNPAVVPVSDTGVKESTSNVTTPVIEVVSLTEAEGVYRDKKYVEASEMFASFVDQHPTNPWGYYMLGLSAWKDGRLDVAETEFKQSLLLDSTHLKTSLNLSRVLLEAHRPGEALTTLDRALEIDSTSGVAYRLKGNALNDLDRTDEAVVAYQSAIQLDPEDAWAMNNLAFIRIREGRYDEALPALARATELRKDVPVFYNNLGMALEHGGHYAAAAEAYGFAVSLDGSNTRAVQNHDRALSVRDDPSIPAVDLTQLAREFESRVLEGALVTTMPADSVVANQPR